MELVKIAHLSDLHFDLTKKNETIWANLVDYLQQSLRPDLILVTGDIVDTPDESLYQKAAEELQGLYEA